MADGRVSTFRHCATSKCFIFPKGSSFGFSCSPLPQNYWGFSTLHDKKIGKKKHFPPVLLFQCFQLEKTIFWDQNLGIFETPIFSIFFPQNALTGSKNFALVQPWTGAHFTLCYLVVFHVIRTLDDVKVNFSCSNALLSKIAFLSCFCGNHSAEILRHFFADKYKLV